MNDNDLSLSLNDIRDEISALAVRLSSPEKCAAIYARLFVECHEITLDVFVKAPQPVRMLKDSRRFVFPEPFFPRIKLIPGSQFVLRSGPEKFLKFRIIVLSILKVKTAYRIRCSRYRLDIQIRGCSLRTQILRRYLMIRIRGIRVRIVPESFR